MWMRRTAKAAARSAWMWVAVLVLGGCALTEGLRQCASVERLRSQDEQQSAGEMRILAARSQEALGVLAASVPPEMAEQLKPHIAAVAEAQGAIVERAAKLETGAQRSEEWQTAAAEALGQPANSVRPDTPEEDDARSDFQRAAKTAGRVRALGRELGVMAGIPQSRLPQSTGGGGLLPLVAGGVTALAGGSGLLALARKALKSLATQQQAAASRQEEHASEIQELRTQLMRVTQVAEELQRMMAAQPASSRPSPPA